MLAVSAEAANAQQADANDSDLIETVLVLGTKQAYRGQFERLETPQMNLEIDEALLRQSGAQDLNQALDLSASVARQNNFGGLWNSFAVRGFVGDENLPSNYLVNGFNAGRGFGGSRDQGLRCLDEESQVVRLISSLNGLPLMKLAAYGLRPPGLIP